MELLRVTFGQQIQPEKVISNKMKKIVDLLLHPKSKICKCTEI